MSFLSHVVVPVIVAAVMYQWMHIPPKITWTPAPQQSYPKCPPETKEQMLMFGATSMLGKYIVASYKEDPNICIINFGRSNCPRCHINIKGDLRDTRHVKRVLDAFDVTTVLTSVKPPLMGVHYRDYVELNLLSMIELIKAAKEKKVKHFIYVSSIAAASHYIPHYNSSELEEKPLYTDYEAPYDVSKRIAEDFLLESHEEGVFNTISIRTSGIYGGVGDPYDYFRLPFIITINCPAIIDANFAANIGDALYVVDRTMKAKNSVGGQYYYYTGESNPERVVAEYVAEATGKPMIEIPYWIVETAIEWWHWARWDPNIYSYLDLGRMAIVPQMFDNSKFFATFDFKPKYTMKDAMMMIYGKNQE